MANKITKVRNPQEVVEVVSDATIALTTSVKYIPIDESDERTAFVALNSGDNAVNITISAGTGYAGTTDEVLSIPSGMAAFYINSNRFKIISGDNKGTIAVKAASTGVSLCPIALGVADEQETPVLV